MKNFKSTIVVLIVIVMPLLTSAQITNVNKKLVKSNTLKTSYNPGIQLNLSKTTLTQLKSIKVPIAPEPPETAKENVEKSSTILTPRKPSMNNIEISSLVGFYSPYYWEVRPHEPYASMTIYSSVTFPKNQMLIIKLGRSLAINRDRKVMIGLGGIIREYPIFSNDGFDYVAAPFAATTSNYNMFIYPMIDNNRNYHPLRITEIKFSDLSTELF